MNKTLDALLVCSRCSSVHARHFIVQEDGSLVCEVCDLRSELKYQEDMMNDPSLPSSVRKNARRRLRAASKKIKALERREE
jgi:uncharacterized Zn finger protein (UPF0148 family)